MSKQKLEQLITSLEKLVVASEDAANLKLYINALKKAAKKPAFFSDDNKIASYVISAVTLFPDIMQNPQNQALKEFCLTLKPDNIKLSSRIYDAFYNIMDINPRMNKLPRSRL